MPMMTSMMLAHDGSQEPGSKRMGMLRRWGGAMRYGCAWILEGGLSAGDANGLRLGKGLMSIWVLRGGGRRVKDCFTLGFTDLARFGAR